MKNKVLFNKLLIAAGTVAVGYIVNEVIEKSWRKITEEESPAETADEEVNWKKAAFYTFLTGALIGAAKTATQRGLTVYLKNQGHAIEA